jgi:hypothetical protein
MGMPDNNLLRSSASPLCSRPCIVHPPPPLPPPPHPQQEPMARLGRLKFPWPLFAYPFYLWNRSPGKQVGAGPALLWMASDSARWSCNVI